MRTHNDGKTTDFSSDLTDETRVVKLIEATKTYEEYLTKSKFLPLAEKLFNLREKKEMSPDDKKEALANIIAGFKKASNGGVYLPQDLPEKKKTSLFKGSVRTGEADRAVLSKAYAIIDKAIRYDKAIRRISTLAETLQDKKMTSKEKVENFIADFNRWEKNAGRIKLGVSTLSSFFHTNSPGKSKFAQQVHAIIDKPELKRTSAPKG